MLTLATAEGAAAAATGVTAYAWLLIVFPALGALLLPLDELLLAGVVRGGPPLEGRGRRGELIADAGPTDGERRGTTHPSREPRDARGTHSPGALGRPLLLPHAGAARSVRGEAPNFCSSG